jgi:hypothetical protein
MRNAMLVTLAAGFVLSSTALTPYVASAQPSPAEMKKDGEIKDPAKADAAISKSEAKDAKKQAHKAHKSAKKAAHKADVQAKKADDAAKKAEKDAAKAPA